MDLKRSPRMESKTVFQQAILTQWKPGMEFNKVHAWRVAPRSRTLKLQPISEEEPFLKDIQEGVFHYVIQRAPDDYESFVIPAHRLDPDDIFYILDHSLVSIHDSNAQKLAEKLDRCKPKTRVISWHDLLPLPITLKWVRTY